MKSGAADPVTGAGGVGLFFKALRITVALSVALHEHYTVYVAAPDLMHLRKKRLAQARS